eukprot:10099867-Karenia_brevis.AAC.1
MQPKDKYTPSMWKNRIAQKATCNDPHVEPTCQCAVCRKELPRAAYDQSQWDNRQRPQRKPTCNGCLHPDVEPT